MEYKTLLYEKKGKITYVTLNRPDSLNSMNNAMRTELYDVWQSVMKDEDTCVVVLTGAGRAFSSGADMREASQTGQLPELARVGAHYFPEDRIEMNKPIVAAVNGVCAGGGLRLLAGCDVVICSEKAEFLDTHVSIGYLPLFEALALMQRMPYGLAMRLELMGSKERMSAKRAYEVGFVSEIVPSDRLMERATAIAEIIASQAPLAVQALKANLFRAFGGPYVEAWKWGAQEEKRVNESEDGKEGPRAFVEKRRPEWKGR